MIFFFILLAIAVLDSFASMCPESKKAEVTPEIKGLIRSIHDSSDFVRRKSAVELKKAADKYHQDVDLYDTLVSYALANLFLFYDSKYSEGMDWLDKLGEAEMPAVCRRFETDKNVEARRALLLSLDRKRFPLSSSILKAGFHDTDSTIVVESIRIYGQNGFKDSFSTMKRLLDSSDILTKVGAIRGLANAEDTSAVRLLLEKVLKRKDRKIPHDFSLVPVNMMSVSANYVVDPSSPYPGVSLHDEAFCSIEKITEQSTGRKVSKVQNWLLSRKPVK
jgi:hypothetical protein